MNNIWHDLRYAVRALSKSPGFAAMAIVSLTLGIGANTAIFSVISNVLLQPLPYEEGDKLVLIEQHASHGMQGLAQQGIGVSVQELEDYRQRNRTLESVAEYHTLWFTLLDRGKPERVQSGIVSTNFFELMGIRPVLGRTFGSGENRRGAEPVLVLSHDFWQSHFGGDPDVIGRTVEMNDRVHTVVGVLPDDLPRYPGNNDVWLASNSSVARAEDDVARIAREMQTEYPEAYPDGAFGTTLSPLKQVLTEEARPLVIVLLGMAGFVLLIACANVTDLTLARMAGREEELAVRAALGAGRGRLMRVLTMQIDLDWSAYMEVADRLEFFRSLVEKTRGIPGVHSVALAGTIPLGGGLPSTGFRIEGEPPPENGTGPRTDVQNVSPDYFDTLRIPLLRGRTFTDLDHDEAPVVAVINQSAARFWGDADPIGTRISNDGVNWVTVVGVVGDVKQEGLAEDFPQQICQPVTQAVPMGVNLLIRTLATPMSVASQATAAVHSIDPRQPVAFVQTMEDVWREDIAPSRLVTLLLGLFAALALIISIAGIVGLMAFTVSQRTRELGIRIALGAEGGSVLWMVIRQGLAVVLVGLAVGVAGALALTRSTGNWLYAITPTDPVTFLSISLVFVSTAVFAAYIPARRAARVDPMVALRDE